LIELVEAHQLGLPERCPAEVGVLGEVRPEEVGDLGEGRAAEVGSPDELRGEEVGFGEEESGEIESIFGPVVNRRAAQDGVNFLAEMYSALVGVAGMHQANGLRVNVARGRMDRPPARLVVRHLNGASWRRRARLLGFRHFAMPWVRLSLP
jgi:hypothetical protein